MQQPPLFVGPIEVRISPREAVTVESEWKACYDFAAALHPDLAHCTRFQTLYAVPEQDLADWEAELIFHLWSISHEADPPHLVRVPNSKSYAINIRDFGIDSHVYGRLAFRDPYLHVSLSKDGKNKEDEGKPTPWLGDPKLVIGLQEKCQSIVPLIRADWFLVETSIQEGRGKPGEGTGYYDFLGVTNRGDYEKLIGANAKEAERLKRQWLAIVRESGVAHFSRQVFREDALGGGHWVTFDVIDDGTGKRNAVRNLDADYEHQIEEHYGINPAGMPACIACDVKGVLQNSAPDRLGPDKTRHGNRTTIDNYSSCVRCHREILRPLEDFVKEQINLPTTANVPVDKALRLRQLYFRGQNLLGKLKQDRKAFSDRLYECNGLEPAENADKWIKCWDWYFEGRLTMQQCAKELGTSVVRLRGVLTAIKAQGQLDPVLLPLLQENGNVKREHWEEVFPVAMTYLGYKP